MNKHHYVAIMAGGVGSRFWPASREAHPKQFLDILGTGKSLLRLTFERFLRLVPSDNIFIVTNARYRKLVQAHLPEIGSHQILGEPSRNNTAPCIAYTAFKLQALDPEANMVVAPSDHLILDEASFIHNLEVALDYADAHDALITLGIEPTRPDIGYGYIRFAPGDGKVKKVLQFTEKPPLEQAQAYLASGDYLWNAGIFVWKAGRVLEAFERHAGEIHRILQAGAGAYNTDQEQAFIDEHYPTTPSISVDYAIMEKADNVDTMPSNFGWSDLGTWASLHANTPKDSYGNHIQAENALTEEVTNCLIRLPKDKLLVARGLEDFIVVDEGDVLLIWPKDQEQAIKPMTQQLHQRFGERYA